MSNNKKRINNEQELLELFCDPDSNREHCKNPYCEKSTKTVYATDGYVAILVSPNVTSLSYEEIEFPIIGSLIKGAVKGHFTLESLKKVLEFFKVEEERFIIEEGRKCEECEGSGDVEWEYTDQDGEIHFLDSDCPVCHGDGMLEEVFKSTGFMVPTDNSFVRIGGLTIRGVYAQKLLWVMEFFNVDKVAFIEQRETIGIDLRNGVQIVIAICEPKWAFQNIVTLETTMQTN